VQWQHPGLTHRPIILLVSSELLLRQLNSLVLLCRNFFYDIHHQHYLTSSHTLAQELRQTQHYCPGLSPLFILRSIAIMAYKEPSSPPCKFQPSPPGTIGISRPPVHSQGLYADYVNNSLGILPSQSPFSGRNTCQPSNSTSTLGCCLKPAVSATGYTGSKEG
jgi:hypothetical protein